MEASLQETAGKSLPYTKHDNTHNSQLCENRQVVGIQNSIHSEPLLVLQKGIGTGICPLQYIPPEFDYKERYHGESLGVF